MVRPVAFFTWNAQTFTERFRRRGLIFLMALLRPFLYSTNRKFATRAVHTVLRGVTRDRLDLLGEEFFQYKLKPRLKERGVCRGAGAGAGRGGCCTGEPGLEHVMRPLAQHLGVKRIVANRLEFRDGMATGRLLEPGDPSARGVRALPRRDIPMAAALRKLWRVIWTFLWKICARR